MTTDSLRFFALRLCVHIELKILISICVHIDRKRIDVEDFFAYVECLRCPPPPLASTHIAIFGSVQYTTTATPPSLLGLELMSSTPHHVGLNADFDFDADFGDFGGEFDASFGFDADFGAVFGNDVDFADFFEGSVTSDFEVGSCGSSGDCRRKRRRRRSRKPNRLFRVESVKNSSWYRNFTEPGATRDLTHALSSSDRFGEFRHDDAHTLPSPSCQRISPLDRASLKSATLSHQPCSCR